MKKVFLILFILLDITVMLGAAVLLYRHFGGTGLDALGLSSRPAFQGTTVAPPTPDSGEAPVRSSTNSLISTPAVNTSTSGVVGTSPAPNEAGSRNIKFSYRNPKAKQVAIRADFTGWKAVPMQKDAAGIWTHQAALTPGEYAYCFTVDDKTFKDPANKRTKQIGRTFVSAILVKPNPSAPAQ